MSFKLSSGNVLQYLIENGICTKADCDSAKIEIKSAKNFNLLVSFADRQLLVKQEPINQRGETAGEFFREWRIQECLKLFPEFRSLVACLPAGILFDKDNSIIVVHYFSGHLNLAAEYYAKHHRFPSLITQSLGKRIAQIHRLTFNSANYLQFFVSGTATGSKLHRLSRIAPEVFGEYPPDGLKFLALYQRYDSLGNAIAALRETLQPCCLIHNDLKLNNILIPEDWEINLDPIANNQSDIALKLIDWERSTWGHPALDLGTLIGSYLLIWLNSLIVSQTIPLEESLRMALIPLNKLQPSIRALIQAYLAEFPEILDDMPQFLDLVIQCSGLSLIQSIQAKLQYEKSFNNTGICTLQVAKSLLCRPQEAIHSVFGLPETELTSQQQ